MQEEKGKMLKILGVVVVAVLAIEAVFWTNYYIFGNRPFFGNSSAVNSYAEYSEGARARENVINLNTKIAMNGKIVSKSGGVIEVQGFIGAAAAKKKFDLSIAKFYDMVKPVTRSEIKTVAVSLKEDKSLFSKIKTGSEISLSFLEVNKDDNVILPSSVVVVSL